MKKLSGKTKKVVISIWSIFISLALGIPFYIYAVSTNLGDLFGGMPSLTALENPENDLSSELITADGISLGKYYRFNRSQVSYADLSEDLVNTLLLSEDHRFYNHSGIDLRSMVRAIIGKLTFNYAGGGSTITMQLAENLYNTMTENQGSLFRIALFKEIIIKTKEWIIATKLERNFTKEEIIAMYLNTVSFGSNAYGIKTASETYFNKPPAELNLQESAVLIGLLQATTRYNPVLNYENAFGKRNQVLSKVYKHSYKLATIKDYDSITSLPIELNYRVQNQNQGHATYFRSVILWDLLAWCKERDIDLYESGLKIFTTIDSRLQTYAEEAVTQHMDTLQRLFDDVWGNDNPWIDRNGKEIDGFIEKVAKRTKRYKDLVERFGENSDSIKVMMNRPERMTVFSWTGELDTLLSSMDSIRYYKKFLNAGFMVMDPYSGHIKAWVGGINHKYFKYDHVRQGRRQTGSVFKPIVYTAAMENGYYPCYEAEDVPVTYTIAGDDKPYRPKNSSGRWSGEKMSIRKGLAQSKNSITVHITNEIGPDKVVNAARRLGISGRLSPVLSIGLGTNDVSVFELIGAYSAFVNRGTWTKPFYISRIEDKHGNVLQNFVPTKREAISEETAFLMLHMIKGTVEEIGGTARRLDYMYNLLKDDNEIGAKTGTTQNFSDGWFVGVTKDLVGGAWVGGDDRSIHFKTIVNGQGAVMALPIWALFMQSIYKDDSSGYVPGPFQKPMRPLSVELDCDKYGTFLEENDSLLLEHELDEVKKEDIF